MVYLKQVAMFGKILYNRKYGLIVGIAGRYVIICKFL